MRGAVFEMPAFPAGWDGSSLDLIRIIDPLGDAIAWFAPDHGASCAGYAVRELGATAHALPLWRDIVIGSPSNPTVTMTEDDDDSADVRWRLMERDPASCTMDWTLASGAHVEYRRLTAALTDGRLSLVLLVQNVGAEPIQARAHLRMAVTSPPRIVTRSADHVSRSRADNDSTPRDLVHPIVLTVDADPSPGTAETTIEGTTAICTASGHSRTAPLPVIQPGMSRRLSVLIGA